MIWGPPSFRIERDNAALNDPFSAFDLSTQYRILVWLIAALFLVGYLLYAYQWRPFAIPTPFKQGALGWYTWYGILAVFSTLYSLRPPYTLFFAGKIVIATLMLSSLINVPLHALNVHTITRLLKLLYAAYIIQWLAIVVLYFVQPELIGNYTTGIGLRVTGGIFNDFGQSAAISGIFFLSQALFNPSALKRNSYWLLYGVTIIFVLLSQTRSVIVPTMLIFAVTLGIQRKLGVKLFFIWLSLWGVLIALLFGSDTIEKFVSRGQTLDSILSLTGRSSAFSHLISHWTGSPIFGYGFAAANRVFMQSYVQPTGRTLDMAHDLVSRVLVDLGIVGLLLLLLCLIFAWQEIFFCYQKARRGEIQPLNLQILSLLLLSTLLCATSPSLADLYWPFLFAITAVQGLKRLLIAEERLQISPITPPSNSYLGNPTLG